MKDFLYNRYFSTMYNDPAINADYVTRDQCVEEGQFVSVSNPNWRSQVKNHLNATTPRSISEKRIVSVKPYEISSNFIYNGERLQRNSYANGTAGLWTYPYVQNDIPSYVSADAKAKAYAKLNSRTVHAHAGIIAGELGKTLQSLRDPLSALTGGARQYLDSVKHKAIRANVRGLNQKKKSRVIQQIIADTWLEYNYAIQPTIKDIQDIVYRVDFLSKEKEISQVKAQYLWDSVDNITQTSISLGVNLINIKRSVRTSYKHYTTVGLLPQVDVDVTTQLGLSNYEWIPTVWELIPYSFLFDYIGNIGKLATSIATVTSGITYVSQTEIIEHVDERIGEFESLTNPNHTLISNVSSPGAVKLLTKKLNRVTNLSFPSFEFHVPNVQQVLNTTALLLSSQRTSYALRGL